MSKIDWAFCIICFVILIIVVIMACSAGYNAGRDGIIAELCEKTNGKYDFCIEKKQWDIKVGIDGKTN